MGADGRSCREHRPKRELAARRGCPARPCWCGSRTVTTLEGHARSWGQELGTGLAPGAS